MQHGGGGAKTKSGSERVTWPEEISKPSRQAKNSNKQKLFACSKQKSILVDTELAA